MVRCDICSSQLSLAKITADPQNPPDGEYGFMENPEPHLDLARILEDLTRSMKALSWTRGPSPPKENTKPLLVHGTLREQPYRE